MKKVLCALLAIILLTGSAVFASPISEWAQDGFLEANSAGLLSYQIMANNLQDDITREEFAELAVNLYTSLTQKKLSEPETIPFSDSQNIQVTKAYSLGIVSGDEKGLFYPERTVTRQEMAKMLYNTISAAGVKTILSPSDTKYIADYTDKNEISSWALDAVVAMHKYDLMNGVSDTQLAPLESASREQAVILSERCYSRFSGRTVIKNTSSITVPKNNASVSDDLDIAWNGVLDADVYHVIVKDDASNPVYIWETTDTSVTVPKTKFQPGNSYSIMIGTKSFNETETFSSAVTFRFEDKTLPAKTPVPTISPSPAPTTPPAVSPSPSPTVSPKPSSGKEAVSEKEKKVFPDGKYFTTKEEADPLMTEVTIPVWNIGANGEKVSSTRTLTVNSALAEDVKAIFDEIYNLPEKFPIYSIGGYSWRNSASGKLSQHSYGTCIDINPNENYYISSSGTILSGSLWAPGENPYSIAEDGEIVRIFAEHGWAWGGNAWSSSRDYMHFSYLGN